MEWIWEFMVCMWVPNGDIPLCFPLNQKRNEPAYQSKAECLKVLDKKVNEHLTMYNFIKQDACIKRASVRDMEKNK